MVKTFPAPWTLHGKGYIMAYRFPRRLRGSRFFTQDFLEEGAFSGFGSVMLVEYADSTAGPYCELLFIPGTFKHKGKNFYSITKIYVSTMESVVNGRANWGIPKEQADFRFTPIDRRRERVTVSVQGEMVLEVVIKKGWFPYFLSTRLFPIPLVQFMEGKWFYTQFNGRGRSKLSSIESIRVNPDYFPDISLYRPLFVKGIENFTIEFPVAETE